MNTVQWPQEFGGVFKTNTTMEGSTSRPLLERKPRPLKDHALNCPRCNSTNTKFCYYNNYSLNQPRYFCKTCRRYWTEGGSLRNVPVGGGSRKNKRSPSSTSSPSSSKKLNTGDPNPHVFPHSASQNPKIHERQDLNLAFPPSAEEYGNMSKFVEVPFISSHESKGHLLNPSSSSVASQHISAMELLKNGMASKGLNTFIPITASESNTIFSTGFPLQEFKPTLNFSFEGFEGGYGSIQGEPGAGARLLFPVEDLKPSSMSTAGYEHSRGGQGDHPSTGYWNGVLGGGSW
ncbi:hypothetical protein Tsubulata_007038 [Turnera subulata]|uniref:Dof zinc finger protein n=1 Tax=Turnera subulata TaxID=218843 RepID=A0A9Q0FED6_9ROSI|nr:hypothetical protein Tsubulata_007038 [Turnera subulata]